MAKATEETKPKKVKQQTNNPLIGSITTIGSIVMIFLILFGAYTLLKSFDVINYTVTSDPTELLICSVGSMLLLKSIQFFKGKRRARQRRIAKEHQAEIKKSREIGIAKGKSLAYQESREKERKENLVNFDRQRQRRHG